MINKKDKKIGLRESSSPSCTASCQPTFDWLWQRSTTGSRSGGSPGT
jgi:hypothetical protein